MSLENRLTSVVQAIGADVKELYRQVNYTHTQAIPSATWTITHNLGRNPSVEVVDSAGTVVEGDIQYVSNNQLTITFVSSFSGYAYLN